MDAESTIQIAVASTNPVKAGAIGGAFRKMFAATPFHIECYPADSGVASQPMSDDETRRGAQNRVQAIRSEFPNADLWAGLEGGVEQTASGMLAFAWIIVETTSVQGAARTATFPLPTAIASLLRDGVELGEADDIVFARENSKQKEGAIGILTNGLVDRQMLYEHAAIMALIPLKNQSLWQAPPASK